MQQWHCETSRLLVWLGTEFRSLWFWCRGAGLPSLWLQPVVVQGGVISWCSQDPPFPKLWHGVEQFSCEQWGCRSYYYSIHELYSILPGVECSGSSTCKLCFSIRAYWQSSCVHCYQRRQPTIAAARHWFDHLNHGGQRSRTRLYILIHGPAHSQPTYRGGSYWCLSIPAHWISGIVLPILPGLSTWSR